MVLSYNDVGTWRTVSALSYNDAGTWRTITNAYYNNAGTWREFFTANTITNHSSLSTNLTHYYKYDANANDSVGTNHLTVTNSTLTTGRISNGYTSDGSADSVGAAVQNINGNTWSVNFWIYDNASSNAFRRWITTTLGGLAGNTLIFREANTGLTQLLVGGQVVNGSAVTRGAWTMYTLVSNGTNVKAYRNGSGTAEITVTTSDSVSESAFYAPGYSSPSSEFTTAILDEVGVWSKALSADEITALYNAGNGLLYN